MIYNYRSQDDRSVTQNTRYTSNFQNVCSYQTNAHGDLRFESSFYAIGENTTYYGSNYQQEVNHENKVTQRKSLKSEEKEKIKKKYVIGKKYKLRNKSFLSVEENIYICKKFIYKIKEEPIDIVVMKLVNKPNRTIYTLSKYDCMILHIKYEPGLQVFSMSENFIEVKQHKSKTNGTSNIAQKEK